MQCKVLDTDYVTNIPDDVLNTLLRQDETEVSICRPCLVKEGLALIYIPRVGHTDNHRVRVLLVDPDGIGDDGLRNIWDNTNKDDLAYFADVSRDFSIEALADQEPDPRSVN